MVFFRCTVGGSGKGNTVTVTCAEEFAGLTITLAKTGKTYTKTCPSTAPYVVTFNGVENGTYTVSCTVDGQTYSETVIVQDISCVLNYGFTWRTWVDTASQLDSSDYDSLDEVLADEKALRELFLEHACVDYMAEATSSNADLETIINDDYCAKWINNSDYALDFLGANTVIKALMDTADKYGYGEWVVVDDTTTPATWGPKGNVPVMTGNTAPYGTAIASRAVSGYEAYRAFDGNYSDSWAPTNTTAATTDYVGYNFTNPICPKKATIRRSTVTYLQSFIIEASNDNSTWTSISDTISFSPGESLKDILLDTNSFYLYLRLRHLSSEGTQLTTITFLQFYGRELKVSVPTMTSNTAPFGEAIILPSANSSTPAWKMFDKSLGSYSGVPDNTTYPHRFGYIFNNKDIVLKMITVQPISNHGEYNPKNCSLEYTEDGTTWEEASETFTLANSTALQVVPISGNSIKGKGFRIVATNGYYTTYNWSGIGELQFYGLDYSEKEFEVGATKKWLYDHGVELETLDKYKGSNTTSAMAYNDGNSLVFDALMPSGSGYTYYNVAGKTVDLTDYSLLRAIIGNVYIGNTNSTNSMRVYNANDIPSSGNFAANTIVASASDGAIVTNPLTDFAIDLSNINGDKWVSVGVWYYPGLSMAITELWLE